MEKLYNTDDAENHIISVLVGIIESNDGNIEFLRGVLAFAHSEALAYGLSWQSMIEKIKAELQINGLQVLDSVNCPLIDK